MFSHHRGNVRNMVLDRMRRITTGLSIARREVVRMAIVNPVAGLSREQGLQAAHRADETFTPQGTVHITQMLAQYHPGAGTQGHGGFQVASGRRPPGWHGLGQGQIRRIAAGPSEYLELP